MTPPEPDSVKQPWAGQEAMPEAQDDPKPVQSPQEPLGAYRRRSETPWKEGIDTQICETLSQHAMRAIEANPQVRSMAIVVDYYESGRRDGLKELVWLGPGRLPNRPEEVVGSLMRTLKLAQIQLLALQDLSERMANEVGALGKEVVDTLNALSLVKKLKSGETE